MLLWLRGPCGESPDQVQHSWRPPRRAALLQRQPGQAQGSWHQGLQEQGNSTLFSRFVFKLELYALQVHVKYVAESDGDDKVGLFLASLPAL